jgi:hypothetical protein
LPLELIDIVNAWQLTQEHESPEPSEDRWTYLVVENPDNEIQIGATIVEGRIPI